MSSRRDVLLFVVISGALAAAAIAIAARYGPTCELGDERCAGAAIERCTTREGMRDPGRVWTEVARCSGDFPVCGPSGETGAACVGPERPPSCDGVRCPEQTACVLVEPPERSGVLRPVCTTSW